MVAGTGLARAGQVGQWCLALIQCGRLGDGSTPDAQANGHAPGVATDQEWLASALERAGKFTDPAAGLKVHAEIGEKLRAGKCTKAEADLITKMIKARHAELAEPVAGVVIPPLEPDDPWSGPATGPGTGLGNRAIYTQLYYGRSDLAEHPVRGLCPARR